LLLEKFIGPDGLMPLLLAFLAEDELPKDDVLELASKCRFPAVSGHASCSKKPSTEGLSQL
jgi:hypothetical protein